MKNFFIFILCFIVSCKSTEKLTKPDLKLEAKSNIEFKLKDEKDCSGKNKILMNAYLKKSEEYTNLWLEYSKVKNENENIKKSLELYADMLKKVQPKNVITKNSNNETNKLKNSLQQKDNDSSKISADNPNLGPKKNSDNSGPLKNKEKTVKKSPLVAFVAVGVSSFISGLLAMLALVYFRKSIPILKLLPF